MHQEALGKHGWSVVAGLLLCIPSGGPAQAAPESTVSAAQLAIGSPLPNSLVAGRITFSVAFNTGLSRISAFTVYVDDKLHYSRSFIGMSTRGVHYLELDTRTLSDGNHVVKIAAMGPRGALATDALIITVRNGGAGAPDLVPPLLQFRGLRDGDTVSGKIPLEVLAEDNSGPDLLVSLFVNRSPVLLKSNPPYLLELNTSEFLDPVTQMGTIRLEAWGYDKAMNLGKAAPITLKVVPPGASPNQTPLQSDPTKPAPLPAPVPATPVAPKADVPGTVPPPAVPAAKPSRSVPGPLIAKNTIAPMPPRFAPAESALPGGLAANRASTPATPPRVKPRASSSRAQVSAPAPLRSTGGGPSAAGPRVSTPEASRPSVSQPVAPPASRPMEPDAVRDMGQGVLIIPLPGPMQSPDGARDQVPAVPPTTSQSTEPTPAGKAPQPQTSGVDGSGGSLAAPRAASPSGKRPDRIASARTRPSNPEIVPAAPGGSGLVVPLPGRRAANPDVPVTAPEPEGTRQAKAATRPAQPATPAAGTDPMVFVVKPGVKGDQPGRLPVDVFLARPSMPKDRSYRVRSGDNLSSIAKKYRVTVKSLLVANGISTPRALRSGSVIKVPGTFDVVMNDRRLAFDVTPRIQNGMPLAPLRQIFEHAGGVVVFYPDTREVRAANGTTEVKVQIGSREATVNQSAVTLDQEAFIDSGRTIVPVSFLEQALDLKAEYDVKTGAIILMKK